MTAAEIRMTMISNLSFIMSVNSIEVARRFFLEADGPNTRLNRNL